MILHTSPIRKEKITQEEMDEHIKTAIPLPLATFVGPTRTKTLYKMSGQGYYFLKVNEKIVTTSDDLDVVLNCYNSA
jgi:hypothetical protein